MATAEITAWGIRFFLWALGFVALARFTTLAAASGCAKRGGHDALPGNRPKFDLADCPPLSVIIPVRNEAESLPALLESLKTQSLTPYEVIAVDDASTDATSEIATDYGARVESSHVPVTGWTGKSHACWVGAEVAGGELLCFLDADVTLGEQGLETLARAHFNHGGLVSTVPRHVTRRPYEALSAFFNVVSAMGAGAFGPLGRRGETEVASGPAMICSVADYEAAGGHRKISAEIVDDVALGRSFSEIGLPVWCFTGGDDISYRMYPSGMNQLIEGWSKNFATGAAWIGIPQFVLVAAWVTGALTAILLIASALVGTVMGSMPASGLIAPTVYYLAYAAQIRYFEIRLGRFPRWAAILFPIGVIFFAAVFACSLLSTYVFHRVSWKGRTIKV